MRKPDTPSDLLVELYPDVTFALRKLLRDSGVSVLQRLGPAGDLLAHGIQQMHLVARTPEILEANERDVAAGRAAGMNDSLIDRLSLDAARVEGLAGGLREPVE